MSDRRPHHRKTERALGTLDGVVEALLSHGLSPEQIRAEVEKAIAAALEEA